MQAVGGLVQQQHLRVAEQRLQSERWRMPMEYSRTDRLPAWARPAVQQRLALRQRRALEARRKVLGFQPFRLSYSTTFSGR